MGFKPSDDGKTVDGKVVVFLTPRRGEEPPPEEPASHAAKKGQEAEKGAHSASGAKQEPGGAAAAAGKAKVRNLRWSVDVASHGQDVEMIAEAPEGASLIFTLEQRAGAGTPWKPLGSVKAQVQGGTAKASMKLEHPGKLDQVHCRFRARLL